MDFDSWENIPKWQSYLDNTQLSQYYDTKIPFTLFHSTKFNVIARAEQISHLLISVTVVHRYGKTTCIKSKQQNIKTVTSKIKRIHKEMNTKQK